MNRKIGMYSSILNLCAVTGFALSMLIGNKFGSYLTSMFIAFSFVPITCAFGVYNAPEKKAAGYTAIIFSGMYAVFTLLVYFAQLTAVRLDNPDGQALQILDYTKYGLFFAYDLLGYGLMAISTFFTGLIIEFKTKAEKWLKSLLLIHGIFAVSCFILPMTGLFNANMKGADWIGIAVLEFWCVYFIPIGFLSFLYFKNKNRN